MSEFTQIIAANYSQREVDTTVINELRRAEVSLAGEVTIALRTIGDNPILTALELGNL